METEETNEESSLVKHLIPLGYMAKFVETSPDWLKAPQVKDVCSVSGCVSRVFADYVPHWKHNGYWMFNSLADLQSVAAAEGISLEKSSLFFYQAHNLEFDEQELRWKPYSKEESFHTEVAQEPGFRTLGYDVVSYSSGHSPECSPLSCNQMAETLSTNEHCLFESFDEAKQALESNRFENCEPGPYRIVLVAVRD